MTQAIGNDLAQNAAAYDSKPWLKSYVKGVPEYVAESPFANLVELITQPAKAFASKMAFTCCLPNGFAGSLTYAEVDELSDRFASYLRNDLGLAKGDRVAVQMPNCLPQPIAVFGVIKAGLVLVNVNPLYTAPEMEHQFNDSGAKALVIMDLFGDKLAEVIPKTQVRHVVTVNVADFFPLLKRAIVRAKLTLTKKIPKAGVHVMPFSAALAAGAQSLASSRDGWRRDELPRGETPATLDDIACLQYTGGTTGVSKGAMLTHRNLIGHIQQIDGYACGAIRRGEETVLTSLPLYHIFAFAFNFLYFWSLGAHNVLVPSPRPMSNLRKPFELYPITVTTGVNTLFAALCNEPWFESKPPPTLRFVIAGGAALLSATAQRFEKITGKPVYEGYGLTESSPVISFQPIGGRCKPDMVGLPLPGTEVRIVDDEGNPVPRGEPGELIARGTQIMLGYWKRPEDTAKVLKDGWLYTGDIATMDEEGYFKIVDRKKDMILVSGFNVYPNEVEDAICKHPDVAECVVIGVPSEATGEEVRAYVVPRGPKLKAEDVREHCKKLLTNYKVPKKVEFRKELPKTPIGKILRKDIRNEVMAAFKKA